MKTSRKFEHPFMYSFSCKARPLRESKRTSDVLIKRVLFEITTVDLSDAFTRLFMVSKKQSTY